jgi:site-specific DNA recombinase
MTKAVGYIRVSTDIQVEQGYGLEIQRQDIETYCANNGIELMGIFEDKGISGAKLFERRGLMNMIDYLERHDGIDLILVPKMDRLSRDAMALGWIEFEIQRRGIKAAIHSLIESENQENNSAIARMQKMLIAYIAEIERERIAQRLAAGRAHKRSKGGYAGGRAPLGYTSELGSKVLHINEAKVPTVRRIFELKAKGYTLVQIASTLNAEGHTTQDNKHFMPMQVKRVLDRESLYRGELEAPAIL